MEYFPELAGRSVLVTDIDDRGHAGQATVCRFDEPGVGVLLLDERDRAEVGERAALAEALEVRLDQVQPEG